MTESRDRHLGNVLAAFALALTDRVREAAEVTAGMTGAAPAALVALQQFLAGRTTEELAQATGVTHSGAVRLVDRLVDAGLADRRPGRDGRSVAITLTARGRALSRKVTAARAHVVEAALGGLSQRDRRALLELVDLLVTTETTQRLDARKGGHRPAWLCRMCDAEACGRSRGECPAANTANDHTARQSL